MLFYQKEFLVFAGTVILFLLLVKNYRAQKVFLLLCSYYFYAYWDWRFLGLVFTITVVDFTIGQLMKRWKDPGRRKSLVVLSVVMNLSFLGVFKYFNFFVESMNHVLGPLGFNLGTLSIVLPVGISFYTFQSLSYTIDVYRNEIQPCDDILDFALCVAFFPQLLSGPIVRARDFLPQLTEPRKLSWVRASYGLREFVIGLFKKVFIADRIAMFVDPVFSAPGVYDGLTIWLAALSYTIQIYCDFSGYSDMAIGTARILGYDFKRNFNLPYLSRSIDEFWRRWHISLSSWLRDYLYISLGGNRGGKYKTYRNLIVTMLLGGLWHGAAWTFVVWGALHGAALAVTRMFRDTRGSQGVEEPSRPLSAVLGWICTMAIVIVGWVLFRAKTFGVAAVMLGKMFALCPGVAWYSPFPVAVIIAFAVVYGLHACGYDKAIDLSGESWYMRTVLLVMIGLVILFFPSGFHPFIYFQF